MTQAAEFSKIMIGDYNNTLTDYSTYIKDIQLPLDHNPTDVTTFAASGGPVTRKAIRGARTATVSITFEYDPTTIWYLLQQLWGARGGSTIQAWQGKNALPTQGDQLYQGTFTLFKVTVNLNAGQELTLVCEFKPTDGGSVSPGWYNV